MTAVIGCGTVFKLTPSGASYIETVLYAFCTATCDSGAFPSAGLVFGKDGALYGTTPIDVDQCLDFHLYDYCGTVFKLTRSGSRYTETTIYTFCAKASCEDGADPSAALIFDKQGALWGTTFYGGTSNLGTVFKLTPSGSGYTESVLHSFTGGSDGAYPYAGADFGAGRCALWHHSRAAASGTEAPSSSWHRRDQVIPRASSFTSMELTAPTQTEV